jgi:hypothetical protein
MTANRFLAIHGKSGITVEVLHLAHPHWPEVQFTGDPDYVQALAEILYPSDDGYEPDIASASEDEDRLIADFVCEPSPLTHGNVLIEVMQWLDELEAE